MLHFQRIDILAGVDIDADGPGQGARYPARQRLFGLHLHRHLPPAAVADQMPRSLVKGLKHTMVLVSRTPLIVWMVSHTKVPISSLLSRRNMLKCHSRQRLNTRSAPRAVGQRCRNIIGAPKFAFNHHDQVSLVHFVRFPACGGCRTRRCTQINRSAVWQPRQDTAASLQSRGTAPLVTVLYLRQPADPASVGKAGKGNWPSIRAMVLPAQTWTPPAKARCGLSPRSRRNSSGWSNTAGSRLAAPIPSVISVPSGLPAPSRNRQQPARCPAGWGFPCAGLPQWPPP